MGNLKCPPQAGKKLIELPPEWGVAEDASLSNPEVAAKMLRFSILPDAVIDNIRSEDRKELTRILLVEVY